MIIEKLKGTIEEIELNGRRTEKVVLDRDRLLKPHQKVTSETGEVFALSLDRGEGLEPGSVIFADEERVVYIELTPEDALVIRPEGQLQWARAAYNVGNMHQTAYIQADCIVTPYDAILASVMQRLGVACARDTVRIEGTRANVSQQQGHQHHTHVHAHTHTHEHTHDHEHEHTHTHTHGDDHE